MVCKAAFSDSEVCDSLFEDLAHLAVQSIDDLGSQDCVGTRGHIMIHLWSGSKLPFLRVKTWNINLNNWTNSRDKILYPILDAHFDAAVKQHSYALLYESWECAHNRLVCPVYTGIKGPHIWY